VKSQQAIDGMKDRMEQQSFPNLREVVKNLYYAAHWTPDRPVDEAKLWTDIRDAAGFKPGGSPKEIPFDGIEVSYSLDRLRQIGHLVSQAKGREFGTTETRALLLLYGQELVSALDETVRKFLQEKLG